MSIDLESLSDEELSTLVESAQSLLARRQSRAAVDRQVAEVLRAARAGGVTEAPEGDAWKQPTSAADAYLAGDVVVHSGKLWASTVDYNVWEPSVSGWREVPGEDDDGNPVIPEYRQPTGEHDAYKIGDQVTWEGDVYRSVIDGNVWSPADNPSGWEKVTD